MRGRKPKPSVIKLVTGNPGKRRGRDDEPRPEARVPPVPAHLSEPAKAEWERVSFELYRLGLLTSIDRAALAAYCQACADWAEAEAKLQEFGKVVKSPVRTKTKTLPDGTVVREETGGYPIQSPFLAIRNKALELMHKFMIEFGMTPSARTRVATNVAKKPADAPKRADSYFSA